MRPWLAVLLAWLLTASCARTEAIPTPVPWQAGATTSTADAPVRLTGTPVPPSNCAHMPLGGFGDVWRDEQVWPRLGCATEPSETVSGTEAYLCDGTHSLWLREKRLFVAIPVWPYPWAFVPDESDLPLDDPLMGEPAPRPEPCFPASGRHGWLARSLHSEAELGPLVRTGEMSFRGAMQRFEGGWLLWNGNVCFVLFADASWTMF